jgi:hypothetical protein
MRCCDTWPDVFGAEVSRAEENGIDATEQLAHWRRWHAYVLDRKGCRTDDDVLDAIAFDRVVAIAAARDLRARRPAALLDHFFAGHVTDRTTVAAVVDEDKVNHLGFQIREPMDMWLQGLTRWAPRLDVAVVGTKRFTSSATFQARVGAFAEMAQIWLDVGGQVVELELFDIHRACQPDRRLFDRVRAGRNTRQLIAECRTDELVALLDDDDIWHYGIHVASGVDVTRLHERFQELTAVDPNYRLRSDGVVSNRWHGSMHTKLANRAAGVEIEFLSYNVDWAAWTD